MNTEQKRFQTNNFNCSLDIIILYILRGTKFLNGKILEFIDNVTRVDLRNLKK